MFQLSRRADYAIRMMIELGKQEPGECLPAREISRKTAVPKAFLHKITKDLVKAALVRTYAGTQGGVTLAQPAADISLLHIIEAVEGPVCLNTCLLRPRECPRDLLCPGHGFWARLQNVLVAELTAVTVADLAAEAKQLSQNPERPSYITYLFTENIEMIPAIG